MRDGDHKFREIELTRNFSKALAFMGYSPDGLDQGFETPEDIYSFVASSPFFSSDIFLLENRNAKARMRDKKRKMYMELLRSEEHTSERQSIMRISYAVIYLKNKINYNHTIT